MGIGFARALGCAAWAVAALLMLGSAAPAQQIDDAQQVREDAQEVREDAILDRANDADDLVESLLELENTPTRTVGDPENETPQPPTAASTTLISVERAEVEELTAAIAAISAMTPRVASDEPAARGDLRAHVEKAMEIAGELLPPEATPVGTAGDAGEGLVTVDRTALQRLEIELDAIEELAPRNLQ